MHATSRPALGRAQACRSYSTTLLVAVFAVIAASVSLLKEGSELHNLWAPPPPSTIERAAGALLANQIRCGTPPAQLVDRPKVVERFSRILNSKPRTAYTVAIGPRGGGKSTAVEMAASKRNGTLSVTVTDHSTMYEVIAEAIRAAEFEAFGTESLRADGFTITTDAQLALVMRKAAALRTPHDPSWIPTLIFEVDQHATDGTVTNVAKMLKRLCVDHRAARVVLVLPDAFAGFALPDDPARQNIVWVEDLSEVEAHAYLNKRHFLLADPKNLTGVEAKRARREELFATVGTRASFLAKAVDDGEGELAAYILDVQQKGMQELKSLFEITTIQTPEGARKSDFQQLVRDMLKRDDGLPWSATKGYLPPNPAVVAGVFKVKGQHAVMYHPLTATYRFHLPAHRQAAALWNQSE